MATISGLGKEHGRRGRAGLERGEGGATAGIQIAEEDAPSIQRGRGMQESCEVTTVRRGGALEMCMESEQEANSGTEEIA
uniref:Bm11922 n=1 Tax=Brugia malayi TaxID=6279 RepID=A0A1I9GAB4_BRUMA|nr:Bm11922 [Brugia malayi]